MNHPKRTRRALAIVRERRGTRGKASISILASEADAHRPRVHRAIEAALAALANCFPYEAFRRLIESPDSRGSVHSRGRRTESDSEAEDTADELKTSLETDLRELLAAWCDEETPERKMLEQVLFAVLLAGFVAAFAKWCRKHGVRVQHDAGGSAEVREVLRNDAAGLLDGVYSHVLDDMEAVIAAGLRCGDSPEELAERVRGHLGDDEYEVKLASTLADGKVAEAFHRGALRLNQMAGGECKQWLVVPDGAACDICCSYEGEGEVDLYYEYAPGIDTPPAHYRCRCGMYYGGVEADSLDALVDGNA